MSETAEVLDSGRAGGLIIRGGALRGLGYALGLLASLLAAAVMFRHIGVEGVGQYVTVVAVVGGLGGLSEAGLTAVGVREYATLEGEERQHYMANLLALRWLLSLGGLVLAVAFVLVAGYGGTVVAGTVLYGIGFVLYLVQAVLVVPLQAHLRLGAVTGLEFLRQLAMALAIVLLVVAGAGLVPLLAVPIPATLLMLGVTVALVRGMPLRPRLDRKVSRALMRDILPYSAASVFAVLYLRAIAVVLSLVSNETQTGYYGVGYRALEALVAIPPLVVSVALPLLARSARHDRERLRYALDRLFQAALILGIGTALAVGLAAELAVDILAGPGFEPSVAVLRILALGLVGSFLIPAWGYGLLSLGRHRAILIATGASFVVAVGLSAGLGATLGAKGGAIAVVAAELTLAFCYALLLFKPSPDLRTDLGPTIRVVAAGLVALAAGAPLVQVSSVLAAAVGIAVYGALLLALRAIPQELFVALRRSSPR